MKSNRRHLLWSSAALALLWSGAGSLAADAASCAGSAPSAVEIAADAQAAAALAATGDQAFAEVSQVGESVEQWAERQRQTHALLMAQDPGAAQLAGYAIELSEAERASLDLDGPNGRQQLLLVGLEKPIGATVRFADAASLRDGDFAGGLLTGTGSGARVWTSVVRSDGAAAVRVHFTQVQLPRGAALYVYNEHGDAFGPYTAGTVSTDGDLWSNTVNGDELRIQLVVDGQDPTGTLQATSFVIADASHVGPRFQLAVREMQDENTRAFCSFNASCVVNGNCYGTGTWSNIDMARRAVAHYIFQRSGGSYICSGGLVNDTVTSSTIPYFLTANHCVSTSAHVNSIEAFWQFTTPCGGACYNPRGQVPRTLGATLLRTGSQQDFTLARLNQNPPSNSVYFGWTSTAVANTNGYALYRLSHPRGAPQAFSRHSVSTSAGTCGSIPRGRFIYSRDTLGATEGGSSGSPVVNVNAQIVGQLFGACGTNLGNVCDSQRNATVDGAFASYYSQVRQWLNP